MRDEDKHVLDQMTLNKLHEIELTMLDVVDSICSKHDLHYFLDSGTALGAVRHSGFIPWDDDVDIGMLRCDYDRFIEIAKEELPPWLCIQDHNTEPLYPNFHAKLRCKNTIYPQEYSVNYQQRGIQLDIFPFDFVSNNDFLAVGQINISRVLRKISDKSHNEKPKNALKAFLWHIIRINGTQYNWDKFEKWIRIYNKKGTKRLTCFSYRMTRKMNLLFDYEDLFPSKYIRFEDRQYQIMNNPDAYLKTMYGDYMRLPPENERVCHVVGEIIFDTQAESGNKKP